MHVTITDANSLQTIVKLTKRNETRISENRLIIASIIIRIHDDKLLRKLKQFIYIYTWLRLPAPRLSRLYNQNSMFDLSKINQVCILSIFLYEKWNSSRQRFIALPLLNLYA